MEMNKLGSLLGERGLIRWAGNFLNAQDRSVLK
jgi:hypothetical protein